MLQTQEKLTTMGTVHVPEHPAADEWVDINYTSAKTGFSKLAILRLIQDGDMPAMQIAGSERKSHRVPRCLVDEAYAIVMNGGQVELRDFCRAWATRNAIPEAVA